MATQETMRDIRSLDPSIRAQLALEDRLGCQGGVTVFDSSDDEELSEREDAILGFGDETPISRALANIGTAILDVSENAECARRRASEEMAIAAELAADDDAADDDDVGMVVPACDVARKYELMISQLTVASSVFALRAIAREFQDIDGVQELVDACDEALALNPSLCLVRAG